MNTTVPGQATAAEAETPASILTQAPPQDLEAEQCVLGGMLLSKDAITDVVDVLEPGFFYKPAHEIVYRTVARLFAQGEPADPITVADALAKSGELARAGGPGYLHALVQTVPTAANAAYYAEIVYERAMLRRLLTAGQRVTALAQAGEGDIEELQDAAAAELNAAIMQRADTETLPIGADDQDLIDTIETYQRGEQATGIPTGFIDLDSLTGGLMPGQMVIIAARPALGKSTLAMDFARHAAFGAGRTVAFFSLEMPRRELQLRCLSAQATVALHHLKSKEGMDARDWNRVAQHMAALREAPLLLDDSTDATVTGIKAKCRRIQQRQGLDLVIIDYLQLLQSGRSRPESRQVEVSDMSRSIKLLAKSLGVPVVVLSQLNREPEKRADKRPMISDLRESGSLEQDADIVILLHRDDAYEKEHPRSGEADLIVAKHRNGPTATVTVAFQGHYSRFVNMQGGY
ncbi:replicative DNA helicase [Streptomyces aidingensis]|uniref:Replicative DNA helicase n=1 Tax=Streptomyces aidingensis TaxID=910347 RepID=A0A1I1UVD5_9ACTN|nr:replicative DNA helicase [Streptomyces aidingensis]SFD74781.1 replicative DNA helicase [Streptomyces aidingensis]